MLILHLFQVRKITRRSSSFQIFRAVISFIATSDWMKEGVAMKYEQFSDDWPAEDVVPKLADFHAAFDVVFVDPSGFLNLMAHTTVGMYLELKHEAERALVLLDDRVNDGFDALFMTPVPWHAKFDLTVVCDKVPPQIARRYPSQLLDRGGDWEAFSMSFIATVIRRAMGDRATLVTSQPRSVGSWAITDAIPSALAGGLHSSPTAKITVGLLLHGSNAARRLDLGPPADDPAAPAFRDFWGPAAQLRRFADGSVMEAVLWDHPPSQAQLTPKSIIHHTLERHANLKPKHVGISIGPLDGAITAYGADADTGAEDARAAIARLDELLKQLRSVASSLPLGIAQLTGISPQFRYTEPLPVRASAAAATAAAAGGGGQAGSAKPLPGSKAGFPDWVPALEVILRFETSGQWPDDVVAIQKVKIAFHLRLAQIVKLKLKLPAVATNQYVDIFCAPYVFRLTIFVEKQVNILKTQLGSMAQMIEAAGGQGASGAATAELVESKAGLTTTLAELERFFVQLPAHSTFAHATQLAHTSYGKAVRLAKRWLCAHMFSDVLGDEAVELLVASLYHTPGAYTAPVSADVALLRFFKLLSTFDWKNDALIVAAAEEMNAVDLSDIKRQFKSDRESFPSMSIFTAGDRTASVWTQTGPDKQILRRIVAFARETAKALQRHIVSAGMKKQGGMADVLQLFRTSLADYDVLIKLKPSTLPRKEQKVDYTPPSAKSQRKKYKNLEADADDHAGTESSTLVDHDPVQCYLRELKKHYGGHALFFYDKLGGDVIGVVWNPDAIAPCSFKAVYSQDAAPVAGGGGGAAVGAGSANAGGSKKKKNKAKQEKGGGDGPGHITLNIPAVMDGFRTLGLGLVKSVTAK